MKWVMPPPLRVVAHVIVVAGVLASVAAVLAAPPAIDDEECFEAIFNGRNLEGWVIESTPGSMPHGDDRPAWSVENGEIVCNGLGFGFLRYAARTFADFRLRAEFLLPTASNSGIGIRTCPFDAELGVGTRPSFHAYEIQLLNDAGKPLSPHSSGSLYRYVAPSAAAMKPAGQWNAIEVTCRGPQIRIVLNGRSVLEFDQSTLPETRDKPLSGFICLQNHCSPVRFRGIRVVEETTAKGPLSRP